MNKIIYPRYFIYFKDANIKYRVVRKPKSRSRIIYNDGSSRESYWDESSLVNDKRRFREVLKSELALII